MGRGLSSRVCVYKHKLCFLLDSTLIDTHTQASNAQWIATAMRSESIADVVEICSVPLDRSPLSSVSEVDEPW